MSSYIMTSLCVIELWCHLSQVTPRTTCTIYICACSMHLPSYLFWPVVIISCSIYIKLSFKPVRISSKWSNVSKSIVNLTIKYLSFSTNTFLLGTSYSVKYEIISPRYFRPLKHEFEPVREHSSESLLLLIRNYLLFVQLCF